MARTKTTVYLDPEVLRATRVAAAREGVKDSDVVEKALRRYLLFDVFDRVRARSNLTPGEAEKVAYEELHGMRRERDAHERAKRA